MTWLLLAVVISEKNLRLECFGLSGSEVVQTFSDKIFFPMRNGVFQFLRKKSIGTHMTVAIHLHPI